MALDGESEDFKDITMDDFDEDDDDDDDVEEEEEEEGEKKEDGKEENGGVGGVEDRFFKIDELEEYMEDDEAREYGLKRKTKKIRSNNKKEDEYDDEEEDGEEGNEGDEEEDDELGFMGLGDDEDGGAEISRCCFFSIYEDFFGSKKGVGQKKNIKSSDLSDDLVTDDDMIDDNQKKKNLSTHEKELEVFRSTIEDTEKANLEEKAWTMSGEVTAARRPKNWKLIWSSSTM